MFSKVRNVFLAIAIVMMGIMCVDVNSEAAAKPEVMISSYYLDDDFAVGTDTKLHISVTNMSRNNGVDGVLITYTSENDTIIPSFGNTNQLYVGTISAEETVELEIPIVVMDSSSGYAHVAFDIEYTAADNHVYNNYSYIMFSLGTQGNIQIKNINVASRAEVGAKSIIGINYYNGGHADLKNVSLIVTGDVTGGLVETPIGDIVSGKNNYFEYNVVYLNVGINTVNIALKYEDENGNTYITDGGSHTVVVNSPEKKVNTSNNEGNANVITNNGSIVSTISVSLIFFGIAALIIVILVVIAIVQTVKRRK